ncbi:MULTISPECIES: ABC transporter ATP-binding protein [Haloarcula]|nr:MULTISPECIES: ABC transporter ATP-binding protein [Halomicroarcula]MBX0349755.1 ABC transporter ATP-binding protein [Halomicroarcula pellucida]MDS0279493.1 ABC transporter ATP-binding protein [Halomicroarcula sp. S1AR25-4]
MTGISYSSVTAGYKSLRVLDDVNLELDRGFNVLLGPNGCGKTTLFRCGCGILQPNEGTVLVDGQNPYEEPSVKREVSYLPHRPVLNTELTVRQNLRFWGKVQNLPTEDVSDRIAQLADRFDFRELLDRNAGELSRGQSQRASIGQALLPDPSVLFLDEATTGLDPMIAQDIRSYLDQLGNTRTVIYSTHDLNEADDLAERLLIMRDGQLVFDGSIEEVRDRAFERPTIGFEAVDTDAARQALENQGYETEIEDSYVVVTKRPETEMSELVTRLARDGINVREVKMMENSVQSLYNNIESSYE